MPSKNELATGVCEALQKQKGVNADGGKSLAIAMRETYCALSAWMAAPDETDELAEAREIIDEIVNGQPYSPSSLRRTKRWLARNGGK